MQDRFVEMLVRDLFDALGTEEPEGFSFGSQQSLAIAEMQRMSPEELARDFALAEAVVEGFAIASQGIDGVTMTALDDCRERVRSAHRQARLQAGLELTPFD